MQRRESTDLVDGLLQDSESARAFIKRIRQTPRMPESFCNAYMACAMWASDDDDGNSLDGVDASISTDAWKVVRADCDRFWKQNWKMIENDASQAGHDFFLTRNGHGAGFWDSDWPEADGKALTAAAHAFGEQHFYIGYDGKIHAE